MIRMLINIIQIQSTQPVCIEYQNDNIWQPQSQSKKNEMNERSQEE